LIKEFTATLPASATSNRIMQKIVSPAKVSGSVQAPASKSVAQRAIAIASLCSGTSAILHPGHCDDVVAAIDVCRQLGAEITPEGDGIKVKGGIKPPRQPLMCGESGLGVRMFSAIAATLDREVVLTGHGSLMRRPMQIIEQSLAALGVQCSTNAGRLPITVKGPLTGGQAEIVGSLSSQVLSGILMAAPMAQNELILQVSNLKSYRYVDVTMEVMKAFGVEVENHHYEKFHVRAGQTYHPATFSVEGDWSGASFMLVAGAIGGQVRVTHLNPEAAQPDRAVLEALERAGALLNISPREEAVNVAKGALNGFEFDATHCPDLFPPLVALASCCKGITRIRGAQRLRAKESDRAATLMDVFSRLGISIRLDGDIMVIEGGKINGATITSHGDHRIAMAGAVAALAATHAVKIEQAEAVNKSYPDFFYDLGALSSQKIHSE
jgi:3-phosphoshikimate 1-carboxyvinyltransferase